MLRITLVLFIVGGTVAQIALPKACPNIETVKNFDVRKHMGKWYKIAVYTNLPVTATDCLKSIHTLYENGSFYIKNIAIVSKDIRVKPLVYGYTAVPTSNAHDGKFTLQVLKAPYWVLATDYDNWLLQWSCRISREEGIRFGWIFMRTKNPSETVIGEALAAVRARKMNPKYFHLLDNSVCPTSY